MAARLIDSLGTTGPLDDLFSDESILQAMLDFEVALARAEARLLIVPKTAADAIQAAAKAGDFDVAALAHEALRAGTPGIPLVKALAARVRATNHDAARFVHWGPTSQDVTDTALILLLKRSQPLLAADLARLDAGLERLSNEHAQTAMLGRTLLQAAPPVTFGLTAAGWLAAIRRGRARLEAAFSEALVLQFGGASGTLAALGDRGLDVGRAVADELSLDFPDAPWHTHRDRLAALLAACGVLTGSLGKMARDISLLMQSEVAEAAEPGGDGRGGSSTMPQKRNPIASAVTLAAADRVPGLVAAFLSGMVQEHERSVGGWQAEWPVVAGVIQATGLAAASMAEAAEGLEVDTSRMRQNIEATRGAAFAERAAVLLAPKLGREDAQDVVKQAVQRAEKQGRRLYEVLAEMPEVGKMLDREALRDLENPEGYLGVANGLRKRLLEPPGKKS
ncbi:MAG TPA: 3-carboxy-cis,cis-muconate cycloisomerase [Candidatus Acidoferrales bacterium]|nr:3-carboxy-cis,cis-muconate cycloisomerase [Candidatus Acidoferrales bacterium]